MSEPTVRGLRKGLLTSCPTDGLRPIRSDQAPARNAVSTSPTAKAESTNPAALGRWFRDSANSGSLERYLETFTHTVAVTQTADWQTLLGDGSVRSLVLTVGEVSKAFADAGQPAAAGHPEAADPEADFINLYMAPVSVPSDGSSRASSRVFRRPWARSRSSPARVR